MHWWQSLRAPIPSDPGPPPAPQYPAWVAYEPDLLPPFELIRQEGVEVLEEWFRWGEEWSVLLRAYARLTRRSAVLEIGCGLGRIAYALRHVLDAGCYDGIDISQSKIERLAARFGERYPNFRFIWADIHNTYYHPAGTIPASSYCFPYPDDSFDVVFAASLFTHMLPENTEHYVAESARLLKRGGRCLFSFYLLDYYRRGARRPYMFARDDFNFDHHLERFGPEFAVANRENPEFMTAYRFALVERFAAGAGLRVVGSPIPGVWSGTVESWVGAQDLVVLEK